MNREYDRSHDVFSIYNMILQNNIKVLIYSGDIDMTVPTISTLEGMKRLDLDIVEKWRSWINVDSQ